MLISYFFYNLKCSRCLWGLEHEKLFGHVKWFDIDKGFGFLVLEDGGGDVLLHSNVLKILEELLYLKTQKLSSNCKGDKGRQVLQFNI